MAYGALRSRHQLSDTVNRFRLITADPDDNKFVDCAVTAGAKYIVTEDNHFNVLKQCSFPRVDVIGLDDFLALLSKS